MDDQVARVAEARIKLRGRFLRDVEATPSIADDRPMGSDTTHGPRDAAIAARAVRDDEMACAQHQRASVVDDGALALARCRDRVERFRQLVENIKKAFILTELPGYETLYLSGAWEEICGRSMDDLYGDSRVRFDAVHPDDREAVQSAIREVKAASRPPTQSSTTGCSTGGWS
jgi:PAS domain S-box-containing protein